MLNYADKKIYISPGSTDMRKGINSLSEIVLKTFDLGDELNNGALFIFANKACNKLKILCWESDGFWLFVKQLEYSKFNWAKFSQQDVIELSEEELSYLLGGAALLHKFKGKNISLAS